MPSEISVSIVAAPCLRLSQAARWNGQPPQTTTGEASARDSHCQLSNCSGGTIASRSTGSESAALITSRRRNARASSSSAAGASSEACGAPLPASGSVAE